MISHKFVVPFVKNIGSMNSVCLTKIEAEEIANSLIKHYGLFGKAIKIYCVVGQILIIPTLKKKFAYLPLVRNLTQVVISLIRMKDCDRA